MTPLEARGALGVGARLGSLALLAALVCTAPARATDDAPAATATPAPQPTVFPLEALRAAAPVEAYRMERAYYDHLLGVARTLAAQQHGRVRNPLAIDGLEPPARPRLSVAVTGAPRQGPGAADITLVVVENLSQIYTQRLDTELQRIRERFADRVALVHVDHVAERTHRHSFGAAIAAQCAHRQDRFWEYRALLLANLDQQRPEDLERYARALDLDATAFATCLDAPEARDTVRASVASARRSGIIQAPTVLVNGVWVGGAEPAGTVTSLVEAAIAARGEAPDVPPESALPFDVTGIMLLPARAPEAIVVERATEQGRVVTVGDRLTDDAVVTAIRPDAVLVRRGERTERLALRLRPSQAAESPLPSDRVLVAENTHVVPVDRALGEQFRAARSGIEAQFTPTKVEIEGRGLLKLTGGEHAALLARVGLEHGDALVRINDAWVVEGRNGLVDAVAGGAPATVVVIRRGIPRLLELRPNGP